MLLNGCVLTEREVLQRLFEHEPRRYVSHRRERTLFSRNMKRGRGLIRRLIEIEIEYA